MKHLNFIVNRICANTPPCCSKRASRFVWVLVLMLTIGVGNVWGATKTEGFEGATTDNNYTTVHSITTSQSDCGIEWTMLGTPSTSSKITGNNSVALRLYSSTSSYPYLQTTTAISGLSQVSFKAKAQTSNSSKFKIDVMYSNNNGTSWSYMKMSSSTGSDYKLQTPGTSASTYTAYVPSGITGSFLFKIAVNSSSSKPTSSNSQCTIDDVVFTYTPTVSYTITAQSSNNTYGTVSLDGSVITATPAENCRIASTAYNVTSGTATIARGTGENINKFTVTPSSNCTVRINFEQIPTHKISFNTGGLVNIDDATGIQEGDTYNINETPAASLTNSCEYGTFVGWTTASSIANVSICPSIITSYTMGASDVILHAVYSKTVGGTGAAVGTKMLAETFEDFSLNNYPTAPGTNATAYSSSTQYACNPNSNNGTRIQTSDGPCSTNAKNIIVKSGGSFAISNIPTGAASTLTFKCRVKGSNTLNITSTEANVALGSNTGTAPERVYTLTVSNNATSFGLNFAASGGNMRLDSIDIAVATTVNGGTTTYSLDANCCTPLGSINGSFFWTTHFCPAWPAKHRS